MRLLRSLILCWVLCGVLATSIARADDRLTLDKVWLGCTVEDLTAIGLTGEPGKSLTGDPMMIYGTSLVHFTGGKAVRISGVNLCQGDQLVLSTGWTKDQVKSSLEKLGWKKDAEKRFNIDIRGYDVWRYVGPHGEVVLVPFSSWNDTVGGSILKTPEAVGPFGDF